VVQSGNRIQRPHPVIMSVPGEIR